MIDIVLFAGRILLVVLLCYKLDKLYPKIMRDLVAREAHGEL